MPDEVERRLAAILNADVVGFSRLMAADEQATVQAASLRTMNRRPISPQPASPQGKRTAI
jgi:hypothetical protein